MSSPDEQPKIDSTPAPVPELRWHPRFTDGDVTFNSSDGIHFAADMKDLARGSEFFKGMADLPRPQVSEDSNGTATSDVPLDVEARSEVVANFFAMIMSRMPLQPPTDFRESCELMQLCYKYDCKAEILGLVRKQLHSVSHGRHWELLAFASKIDDRALGKMILKTLDWTAFRPEAFGDFCQSQIRDYLSILSSSWQGRIYHDAYVEKKVTYQRKVWKECLSKKNRPYMGWDYEPFETWGFVPKENLQGAWDEFDKSNW